MRTPQAYTYTSVLHHYCYRLLSIIARNRAEQCLLWSSHITYALRSAGMCDQLDLSLIIHIYKVQIPTILQIGSFADPNSD